MKLARSLVVFLILIQSFRLQNIESARHTKLTEYTQFLKQKLSQNSSFTYYSFVREWPGTVCQQKQCNAKYLLKYDGADFNMHGLWPSGFVDAPCKWPENCLSSKYNESLMDQEVLDWMNTYYTGLYSDGKWFRAHEFEKHGTCYKFNSTRTDLLTMQNEFFHKVMELNSEHNLVKALASHQIIPSNTISYMVDDFLDAMNSYFRYETDVQIKCVLLNNKQYIQEIKIDFDTSFNLMKKPCPKNSNGCNKQVDLWFPIFQKNHVQQIQ